MSDFERRAFFEEDELVGARWWQEHLAATLARRETLKALGALAVALVGVGVTAKLLSRVGGGTSFSQGDVQATSPALELQKVEGWDVGKTGTVLPRATAVTWNVDQKTCTDADALSLADDLAPAEARFAPYYVSTLFQSVAPTTPSAATLRTAVMPVFDSEMERAFSQGHSLTTLFAGLPPDTAVVVDMKGPVAIAFAAGMADLFAPVFVFDNWPHPAGIVPAHETLGAALYYAPLFKRFSRERTSPAPPVFVLDAARLAPYVDDKTQFDNRYTARLPSASALRDLGIRHVLYVTDGGAHESDDLNEYFVAYAADGIAVKLVDRNEFSLAAGEPADAPATIGKDGGTVMTDAGYTLAARHPYTTTTYYYGGTPSSHFWFWRSYGWYASPATARATPPTWTTVPRGPSYAPEPRPTLFSAGRRPGGFGMVSFSRSRDTGQLSSTSYGGRSGSFGRAGPSGGGGYGGGTSG